MRCPRGPLATLDGDVRGQRRGARRWRWRPTAFMDGHPARQYLCDTRPFQRLWKLDIATAVTCIQRTWRLFLPTLILDSHAELVSSEATSRTIFAPRHQGIHQFNP